jgi:hypothetical protein
MSNKESRDSFKKNEKRIMNFYIIIVSITFVIDAYQQILLTFYYADMSEAVRNTISIMKAI